MTASAQIIQYLTINRPTGFSNTELANALQLPQNSVRRVINELRAAGRVIVATVASVTNSRQWTVSY